MSQQLRIAFAGAIIGGTIGLFLWLFVRFFRGLIGAPAKKSLPKPDATSRVRLYQEELDISKKKISTGDVNIHKELIQEEKTITVPISREELVIERRLCTSKDKNAFTETTRIPLREEKVEVLKHPIVLNDISIHHHQYQKSQHVEETLKKEQLHIETVGKVKLVDQRGKNNPKAKDLL